MNELNADLERRLAELILRAEESATSGICLSVTELCRDCPELAVDLEVAMSRLQSLDQFMFPERNARTVTVAGALAGSIGSSNHKDSEARRGFPTVPGYEILAEVGRGGMGIVYKARQESLGRLVAIKTLHGSHWGNSAYVARLRWEAKGLSRLAHPNVVRVIDVVETPVAVSIILEFVEGENLSRRLQGLAMVPKKAAELALELARTLAFVHQHGLLHRDIKPGNVMIDVNGSIKVADFGLVKEDVGFVELAETGEHQIITVKSDQPTEVGQGILTAVGECLGTPNYMAPEQTWGNQAAVDVRCDVYGIGATLYEMLSGRPPFQGVSQADTFEQVRHRPPASLSLSNPTIPRDLKTICLKCLEKEPERRFRNAQELAEELDRFQRGLPILSRPIGSVERGWRWCRRRPALASLMATSLAGLLAVVALLAVNNRNLATYNRDLTRVFDELKSTVSELNVAAATAKTLQRVAEQHERQAKDGLYAADINRAAIAMVQGDTRELTSLLERQIPGPNEVDRRGFEWWHLYRKAKRARRLLLEVDAPLYLLRPTPTRDFLAVAGADAVVRIIHPETGQLEQQIPTGQIEVNGVAYSPNGKELATAGDDGTIIIWNRKTAMPRLVIKAHPGKVFQLVYTQNGSQIISCGNNPVIRAFDTGTGEPVFVLEGHVDTVQSLFLADDGKTLVSTADDLSVRLWNLEDRTELMSFTSTGDVGPAEFDRKRSLLIVGNASGDLQTFDTREKREIKSLKHLDRISSLALHRNGQLLAVGNASGQIRLRSLSPTGEFMEDSYQPWHAHRGVVHSLVWSPDGSRLTSAGDDGRVFSWDLSVARSAEPKEIELAMGDEFRRQPTTSRLLVRSPQNIVIHWDWKQEQPVSRCSTPGLTLSSVSPDGKMFAAVLPRGLNENFDKSDEAHLYAIPAEPGVALDQGLIAKWAPMQGELRNIRFSPDSQMIAVSKWYQRNPDEVEDHTVWLVDLNQIDSPRRIPVLFAKDCCFSPDGKRVALVTRTALVLWDIASETIVWEVPNTFIQQIAYSHDGTLIATCGNDRLVRVVDSRDGTIRFQSTNHRAPVRCVVFSPDGRLLATAAGDGTIKLWHVASGQELVELPNAVDDIPHIEFSDDGNQLICQMRRHGSTDVSDRIVIFDGSRFDP